MLLSKEMWGQGDAGLGRRIQQEPGSQEGEVLTHFPGFVLVE